MNFGKQTIQYNRVHVDQSVPFLPTQLSLLTSSKFGGGGSSWGGGGGIIPYLCIR